METNLFIPLILGTAREGRRSEHVARFILKAVERYGGITTELIDVRDYLFTRTDDTGESDMAKRYREKITRADGLIIVSPEYNHGYPGELKLLLDSAYDEYAHKPVGVCGVSSGQMGGDRMMEQLRLILIDFALVPIKSAIYFPYIKTLFRDGEITDPSFTERVKKFLDELVWFASALKAARQS
ncbi:MAG: NADPH-dependent FMN reductase [bacterium]|nr:NADPH-dependent FMN reductase [bacterium]MDZ4299368.1 NADPH-dependent FMN reductase [Candidatus Sungbacteria bacterium]